MTNLREALESLTVFCWNTTEEDVLEEKVQEYLRNYPHLRNPATIDLLYETVKMWQRIQRLESIMEKMEAHDPIEASKMMAKIKNMTMAWVRMLGNLGISFTRQQYKTKKKMVQPPVERLKMLKPNQKEKKK